MNKNKNIITAINMGMRANLTSITIKGTKTIFILLKKLEAEGIIRGFKILDFKTSTISIFLKYKKDNKRLIKDIKTFGTSKAKIYLTGNQMKKIKNDYNIYIVTSRLGLHTTTELKAKTKELNLKIGGELKYLVPINDIYTRIEER